MREKSIQNFPDFSANMHVQAGPFSSFLNNYRHEDEPSAPLAGRNDAMNIEDDVSSDYLSVPGATTADEEGGSDKTTQLRGHVSDYLDHAIPVLRHDQFKRDRDLQAERMSTADPHMMIAGMFGAWNMISKMFGDDANDFSEEQLKSSCSQMVPFFQLYADMVRKHGFSSVIQVLGRDDHVDVDASIIALTRDNYLKRTHLQELKWKALSLNKRSGYAPPVALYADDIALAHEANTAIRLPFGQYTVTPAPIPAHLLRDAIAASRYVATCLPGTYFLEHIPTEIERARIAFGVCMGCAGHHIFRTPQVCLETKIEERNIIAPHYDIRVIGNNPALPYFMPNAASSDMDVHAQFFQNVYPGSTFPFSRVPPTILEARELFGACPACGITHLPSHMTIRACPYNVSLQAESFVRDFQTAERHWSRDHYA